MNKFNARRTEYPAGSGAWYDSGGEAGYAHRLDLLKAAGLIHDWRRGQEWVLLPAPPGGTKRDRITLKPDFEVWTTPASFRCIDFKGMVTDVFKLKARLFKDRYPDTELWIVKADGTEKRL